MNPPVRGRLQIAWLFAFIGLAGFSASARADIPDLARQTSENAKATGLLVRLARAAEARGDLFTCARLAKEADRLATNTDLLRQEAVAEYNQLPPAQQRAVFADKENVIADAAITRQDADSIKDCGEKVRLILIAFGLFLIVLFLWLLWRAFGPFRLKED